MKLGGGGESYSAPRTHHAARAARQIAPSAPAWSRAAFPETISGAAPFPVGAVRGPEARALPFGPLRSAITAITPLLLLHASAHQSPTFFLEPS